MTNALIGHTGFVGSNLARSRSYGACFNRANLGEMRGRSFARIDCAGLPAAKWIANRDPAADLANVELLCEALRTVEAQRFVLISTVDVYPEPTGRDEADDPTGADNHAYGRHRLMFEAFVRERFPAACVLRLPALFGRGLRKNVIYDLLHDNQLEVINPQSSFQWYPLARLPEDIDRALDAGIGLANLVTEPVATARILQRSFPAKRVGTKPAPRAAYDLRTRHAATFGGSGGYLMPQRAVLDAIDAYARDPGRDA